MKKNALIFVMVIAVSIFVVGKAQAALLGVQLSLPDVFSDTTGTYSYNAATNLFTSLAKPVTITFDGVNLINIIGAGKTYSASFLVDEFGNFAGGVAGDDLFITGGIDTNGNGVIDGGELSGTLLTGEITKFGWLDIPPTTIDAFDYRFDVTGGLLAGFYGPLGGGDVLTTEVSTFAGDFNSNFSGIKAKHDTAPIVPEPASMALLGIGVLGLFGLKRKS